MVFFTPFAPCDPLCGSKYRPSFEHQYLENGKSKHCLQKGFIKVFNKLSNNIQVYRRRTCGSLVMDV